MRTGSEIAVFVTRRSREVLLVHRVPELGGYWHVIAGGVEPGESAVQAAERELHEETGLTAHIDPGEATMEYAYELTEEPAERRDAQHDPSVVAVGVKCFRARRRMIGSRPSTASTMITAGARLLKRLRRCDGQQPLRHSGGCSLTPRHGVQTRFSSS